MNRGIAQQNMILGRRAPQVVDGAALWPALNPTPFEREIIGMELLQDDSACVVKISVDSGNLRFAATASSKRKPGDKRDAQYGRRLAISRALRALSDYMEKELASGNYDRF